MIADSASARYRAYLAWSRAAGPFWQYVSALPFTVAVEKTPAPVAIDEGRDLLNRYLRPYLDAVRGRALLLLDVPLLAALATAPALLDYGYLVAPMVFRWHGERTELPTAPAQSALLWLAPRIHAPAAPRGIALLFDGERGGMSTPPAPNRRLDNRYGYPADVFPPAAALRDWNVSAVVSAASASRPREDVADYLGRLQSADLPVTRLWVPEPGGANEKR